MGGVLRLALHSSHASAISCISLDFAGAALGAVEPMQLGQHGVSLLLQLLAHCVSLLQQVRTTSTEPKTRFLSCTTPNPSHELHRAQTDFL